MSATSTHTGIEDASSFALTPQQVRFYETFGFLHLPGLFRPEIDTITAAFEEVFAASPDPFVVPENPYHRARDPQYTSNPRVAVTGIDELHPVFGRLRSDPRVRGIAAALLGDGYEYQVTDGNLFYCDVYWHLDGYGTTTNEEHIKLYFYLDVLREDSGALRFIPGTHYEKSSYTVALRQLFFDIENAPSKIGVELDEVPGWTMNVNPGDLVVGNFRTLHGSFGGGPRRRLITMDFHRSAV
jgi:hypothetical protein